MKKYLALLLTILLVATIFSFTGAEEKHYKFGLTTMGEASFWDAVNEGVHKVLREGDEVIFVEGEHGNAPGQVSIIEDFITQGVDLVFYNPVDADAASTALNLLEEKGIPVINFDSPCTDMSTIELVCPQSLYQPVS